VKTEDCRQWLASNSEIQQLVKDRYGWDDDPIALLEMCDFDQEEVEFIKNIVRLAAEPGNWKRTRKYNLGSETDKENRDYSLSHPGEGVVRNFELKNSEVEVVILEQDGQLQFLDDMSD
jgi:hypothetical protein